MLLSNIPAIVLTALFFISCFVLLHRWWKARNNMILVSGFLPCLLFGVIYLVFSLGEFGVIPVIMPELRAPIVRSSLFVWQILVILNYYVRWRKGELP